MMSTLDDNFLLSNQGTNWFLEIIIDSLREESTSMSSFGYFIQDVSLLQIHNFLL